MSNYHDHYGRPRPDRLSTNFDNVKPVTDLDGNGDIDLVWAGRADEITDDNLGSGLINKREAGKTKLSLVPATDGSIGGVKAGENINIDDEGEISVTFPAPYTLPTATTTRLGGVKVGTGINVDADGRISVDPYILPKASDTVLGGVRIGENITLDPSTGEISVVYPVATVDKHGIIKVGQNLSVDDEGVLSADVPASVLDDVARIASDMEQYKKLVISLADQVDASEVLNPIISWYNGAVMGGTCRFNSANGKKVLLRLEFPMSTLNYRLVIFPGSDTDGTVGEFWVASKSNNSFIVKNSGGNFSDSFDWMLIKDDAPAYSSNTFPFMRGEGVFNSAAGRTITLPSSIANANYRVIVTPTSDSGAKIGEYWVEKSAGSFIVKNTGSNNTATFDWIVLGPGMNFAEAQFPFQYGSGTVSGGAGTVINLPQPLATLNYRLFVMPTKDAAGLLGEIWTEMRGTNSFTVKCSGSAKDIPFDWIMLIHYP